MIVKSQKSKYLLINIEKMGTGIWNLVQLNLVEYFQIYIDDIYVYNRKLSKKY